VRRFIDPPAGLAARFRGEAAALAKLRHPNIVPLYDAGVHDGEPYLALEYADGGTLHHRLGDRALPAAEAAGACVTLARAVAHAHRMGVVHRDLKPENVLIHDPDGGSPADPHPGRPIPGTLKLADFGLARLLAAAGSTTAHQVVGTPAYMAPEQWAGGPDRVGPAADIYGLGAILYRLLTGRPPVAGDSPAEAARLAREVDPVPPRAVRPRLPRDLEVICLKCLEKAPGRRYPTADALADDLQRFLDGRPVLARPVGPVGRAVKLARRRPLAAGLSAALAAVALGSLAGLSYLYRRAEAERAVAVTARGQAEAAADRAAAALRTQEAVTAFLFDEVYRVRGRAAADRPAGDLTLKEALGRAAGSIPGRFADRPLLAGKLEQAVGVNYRHLGDYPAAERHLTRAVEVLSPLTATHPDEADDAANSLAVLLDTMGRSAAAADRHRRLWQDRTARLGADHPSTLTSRHNLGAALHDAGRDDEAIEHLSATLAARRAVLPAAHPHTVSTLTALAAATLGRSPADADRLSAEAVERAARGLPADDPAGLAARSVRVRVLLARQRFAEAAGPAEACWVGRARALGDDHPDTLAALSDLARVDFAAGRTDLAERRLRAVLAGQQRALGDGHRHTLKTGYNLGMLLLLSDRPGPARTAFERALVGQLRHLGPAHPDVALTRNALSGIPAEQAPPPRPAD
jgi:tetratricopeptide (TPR) repeat protein